MRFIVDANMPRYLVSRLRSEDYDIVDIRDFLPPDAPDSEVFEEALRQQRTIITRDKLFGNIILYPPEKHYGVILMRTKKLNTGEMTNLLLEYLRKTGETDCSGYIFILENKKYRKRSHNHF